MLLAGSCTILVGWLGAWTEPAFVCPQDDEKRAYVHDDARVEKAPSCTVCHPGEHASLARSVHAPLIRTAIVEGRGRDASCLACHDNGIAHQENSRSSDAEHAPGAGANSCQSCHEDVRPLGRQAHLTSHPSKDEARDALAELRALVQSPTLPRADRMLPSLDGLNADLERLSLEGLVRAGWRFVSVSGSERVFDHDWNLDSGPRLAALELRALRGGRQLAAIEAGGLEDRAFWLRGSTGDALHEALEADGGWRRNRWVYDADGDWASLSSKRDRGDATLALDLAAHRLELGWERVALDERTLASSIGDPGSSPLEPATGIPVDRRFVSDRLFVSSEWELGDHRAAGSLGLEFGWESSRQRDELRYARPSPVLPSFTEREASESRASRRGPDANLRLALGDDGARELRAVLFALDHDVRVVESGTLEAYDTSSFRRETLGTGSGSRRFLSAEIAAAEPLWEDARLLLELGWRDHRDHLELELFETTIRPPISVVDASTQVSRVRAQDRELRVGLEQACFDDVLEIVAAFRWHEQELEVPDLAALDSDYRAGTIRTRGPELALDWRPDRDWRVRGELRWAGTDDRQPTETQPEVGQFARLRVRRRFSSGASPDGHIEAWAKWRRGENDVASTEIDAQSYGVGTALAPFDGARISGRVGFSRIRSQTLSNFYFAPSIIPVPTRIRYRGDTWLADLGFEAPILRDTLQSVTTASLTHTDGSLDTSLWRVDEELRLRIRADDSWTLGLRASLLSYDGETAFGRDEDYDAVVVFVYSELRF